MSRPLRLEFTDATYHVTSRGDRREDIYHDDADRQAWLNGAQAHWCRSVFDVCAMSEKPGLHEPA